MFRICKTGIILVYWTFQIRTLIPSSVKYLLLPLVVIKNFLSSESVLHIGYLSVISIGFKINKGMLSNLISFRRIDRVFFDSGEILFLIFPFDFNPFFSNLPINSLDSCYFFHKQMSFWHRM